MYISKYITKFMDDNYTIFTRGKYIIGGRVYEYKLEDSKGTDYCTQDQIDSWGIKLLTILEEDETIKQELNEGDEA